MPEYRWHSSREGRWIELGSDERAAQELADSGKAVQVRPVVPWERLPPTYESTAAPLNQDRQD